MNKPKAILFDLGDTILKEECFNPVAGTARLLELAENPKDVNQQDIQKLAEELNADLIPRKYRSLLELSWRAFNRHLFERLGITLRISVEESELEFWKASVIMTPTPGIAQLLQTLSEKKISIGIISNAAFCETTLKWELTRHGLAERFSFLMSSTDYGVRKPHPFLFLTAIARLGLDPCDIWFVGDSLANDIEGALNVGMVAIWYNPSGLPCEGQSPNAEIKHWEEFLQHVQHYS